jgi:hypothetical protein
MTNETTTSPWTIAKCYRVLRPFQAAIGRLDKLYPSLRAYPYHEGVNVENSTQHRRLRPSRRQIVTYSRQAANNSINKRESSKSIKEKRLIRNLIQGDDDDDGEAFREKTLAILQRWCSSECYDCVVGIERAFRQLALVVGSCGGQKDAISNSIRLSTYESLQQRCALGVGRAVALSAPAAEGEWYTHSEAPYLRRWRKTMVAGHAAQLLVNTFCSVPEDLLDASENESDGGDESDNDERNLMLGLLGREASLLVFPLFAVAAQHPLAAQVLVAEYVKAVRAAPQNMANLWALPCLFRRGLIMLNEVLDLAHIVIEAGGAPPQDVHLFLQILPSGAGAEANGNSATTIMHFLKACVTNPRIAASACVYPLFAYTLVHANCLLANDSMATPHKLFGIVDQDGLGLTAQLLCEVPNRLRPLPGADVFEHVLGYLLSQQKLQRKSSHIAEDEQALRRRLTRVAGLSSEHREFVCTALANVTRHPGDGSFPATAATETGWIQELLEKHGIDDLYDDMSTVHTGARGTSKRKRKGVAIAHENCRENNHYTRSKLPRELEINHIWPQTLNRQCLQKQNRTTTRGLKENNPLMPIISSSEDSISDDPNHNWESNTSRISINCTELEFGSSSDGDSGDLIPVRPPRVSKHSRQWQPRRRITLVMPPTSYSDESDPLLSSVPPEPSFFLVDTDSSDNTNSGDNNDDSDDDLLLLHHPSTNISAASRRRKIQSPEMPVSKRARLRCRAVHSASRSSSSLSNEGDDDDDDLLMT